MHPYITLRHIEHELSNSWLTIFTPSAFANLITSFIDIYGNLKQISSITCLSTISAEDIASLAASRYAIISPDVPSFMPPKYLTTTIRMSVSPKEFICPKIGFPAVPLGSPLSFDIYTSREAPIIYA